MVPVLASKFLSKISPLDRAVLCDSGIIPINDAFFNFYQAYRRYWVLYGGRGSGKSKSIAQKLVRKCANDRYFRWQYSRKNQVDIKESQFELLKQTISEYKVWNDFKFNESTMRITHRSGNAFIAKGMDDPEKSKGLTDLNGFWGEEITEFEQLDFITVNQNLRTQKAPIESIISFNPIHEDHWVRHYFFSPENPHKANEALGNIEVLRTTLWHNYFINREQYAKDLTAGAAGNRNIIRVVLEGDWGLTENGNPWLHAFDQDKHVAEIPYLQDYPLYLSFDFNNDPFACTIWQMHPDFGGKYAWIHCIDEIVGEMKVETMCQRIRSKYPHAIYYLTGDRSGDNDDIGRNQTLYQMIAGYLGITDACMNLNSSNLSHADSRLLINVMFHNYPIVRINKTCTTLITDCQKATIDVKTDKPSKLLKDRENYKMDAFDAMRYFFQTYFHEWAMQAYMRVLCKK